MERPVPARLTASEGRRFAFPVGGAFLVLCGVFVWREHETLAIGAGALGSLLVLAGLVVPSRLGPVYRAWMGLALAISRVTTPVFMGIVYFLVITPIGALRRWLGGDPMEHPDREGGFWAARDPGDRHGNLERQF